MKKQKINISVSSKPGLQAFLLFFLLYSTAYAQSALTADGQIIALQYTGSYQDFLIPQQASYKAIRFKLQGGDGGSAKVTDSSSKVAGFDQCYSPGGLGASVEVLFEVGAGAGQLLPGSTIRFIVGGKGSNEEVGSILGATAAGGGGGGSAVLYKKKGSSEWTILAVAGGGGGAYQGVAFGSCQDGSSGGSGRAVESGGGGKGTYAGSGGSNGGGGKGGGGVGDGDLAGGGGGATADGKGGDDKEGLKGAWTGGKGGSGRTNGSFGFGSGGAARLSGGGGGGYSGGGGGGMTGNGGGGGSYVNAALAVEQMALENAYRGLVYGNGFIQYEFTDFGISVALTPANTENYAPNATKKDLHVQWLSSNTPDRMPVYLWDHGGSSPTYNERWYYDDLTSSFRLFKDPSKCLDLSSMNENGAAIYLYSCHFETNQRWTFGQLHIQPKDDPSYCLALKYANLDNGNPIQSWKCASAPADQRRWIVSHHQYKTQASGANDYANYDWYRYGTSNTIRLANNNKCIDNRADKAVNGNNIQLYTCLEASRPAQSWFIDKSAVRLSASTDMCLDLSQGKTANGTNIQLWGCQDGNRNQAWIYDVANQSIRSGVDFNKCVDLARSNTADETNIQLWDCNNTGAQKWLVDGIPSAMPTGAGNSIRLAMAPNKCVDISQSNTANGANIQLYDCNGTNAQHFLFDGRAIKMQSSPNKCLDLRQSSDGNGTNIQLFDCNGTNAQQWIYDGFAKAFRSAVNTNKCLDVDHSNTANGTNIQLWDCNGTGAQRFEIGQ